MNRYQRVQFGKKYESILHPLLEDVFQEKLKKTAEMFDTMDFEGDSCWVELKVRSHIYHPSQFKDWLLPYCKTKKSYGSKNVFFVYYWTSTKQMFIVPYSSQFDSYVVDVPEWKQDGQLQVYVPSHHWEEIKIIET